eukprot:TRINITY_DN30060_c0_g1_i1.p1 TRINITY_DN30060_c0_g1~~TRINITY_DN30060_c0_g1_i1.p1  ORF type:complete len:332 (+),score=44.47 TRINITY_DN30060_c0_g1_i1:113-1108(+)
MAAVDASDIRLEEDRKRYFRDIGLEVAAARMNMLQKRADHLRSGCCWRAPGESDGALMLDNVNVNSQLPAVGTSMASRGVSTDGAAQTAGASKMTSKAGSKATRMPSTLPTSGARSPPLAPPMSSPSTPRQTYTSPSSIELKDEMCKARQKVQTRVRKYRDDLVDDWRQFEVSLQQRPTTAEREKPENRYFAHCRRPHYRVVVGRDVREIQGMPNNKLCINDSLKRSLGKMRENLFQRRLQMAILEKTIGEWSMTEMRKEARRERRQKRPTATSGSLPAVGTTAGASSAATGGASGQGTLSGSAVATGPVLPESPVTAEEDAAVGVVGAAP